MWEVWERRGGRVETGQVGYQDLNKRYRFPLHPVPGTELLNLLEFPK